MVELKIYKDIYESRRVRDVYPVMNTVFLRGWVVAISRVSLWNSCIVGGFLLSLLRGRSD